jgi:autotransporter-associated beta strand protein
VLLTVPMATNGQTLVTLNPTADAQVSNAATTTNFGSATTALVARSATNTNDQATYFKFNRGANSNARVGRAFLHLTGGNIANSDTTILHVYGIKNDSWTESGITWSNAPDLGSSATDARLQNVGSDAFPVGQLTWDNTVNEWGIDVTEFVRKNSDLDLSFVVIREQRFAPGYAYDPDGDADTSQIQLNTREAVTGQPRLSLFMTNQPVYYWSANPDSKTAVNFTAATSWDAGASPNAGSAIAVMSDFITAPRTITMDAPATVGELRFDNWNSLKISGDAMLTLSNIGGQGMINVYKGSHTIDTPITLGSSSSFGVGDGLKLTISKPIGGSGALVKTGPGMVELTAPNTYTGQTLAADGLLRLAASLTSSSSVSAQGNARIELAAGGNKIIKTGGLAITGNAVVDLADNRLITTSAVGTASGGVYSGVSGLIQRSYNFTAWNGPGLNSSSAALTGGLTTLGVGDASALMGLGETETAMWSGQIITGASTLVMYTYRGDANLDGVIDGGDYGSIDNNVQIPGADGYANGDFNYDGVIDGGDYGVIDNNIQAQGAPFPVSGSVGMSGVTVIPEPSALGLTVLGSSIALRRRRCTLLR